VPVTRRFRSESVHKVDQKGRVSVPALFRRAIEEGDPDWSPGQSPTFVLIYGMPSGRCLEGYTMEGAARLDDKVSRMPSFSKSRRALERLLNTQSVYVQIDDNGRIVLPQRLREMVDLDTEAYFAGMGEHFQIWAPEQFEEDDDELATALAAFGGEDETENVFSILDEGLDGDGS
jgi:MraZ protein